jgi:hypothetical protein
VWHQVRRDGLTCQAQLAALAGFELSLAVHVNIDFLGAAIEVPEHRTFLKELAVLLHDVYRIPLLFSYYIALCCAELFDSAAMP